MKAGTFALAAAVLPLVSGSPHRRHADFHEKRELFTEYVTVQAPDVVVWVDEFGRTISSNAAPTPAAAPAPPAVNVAVKPTPAAVPAAAPVAAQNKVVAAPKPEVAKPAPVAAAAPVIEAPALEGQPTEDNGPVEFNQRYASAAAGVNKANGYGISWTPFKGPEGAVNCKTQEESNAEFAKIAQQQFTNVRIYGPACDQVRLAMNAAQANGIRLMLGVFELGNAVGEVHQVIDQVRATGNNWGIVDAISIGNENVQNGMPVQQVLDAVAAARPLFGNAGYQGPIIHVDTAGAILANRQLCSTAAGDFIAANVHPFFNPHTTASSAGWFVANQVGLLRACSAMHSKKRKAHRVVVTETGWPTGGSPNQRAIPGRVHQFRAIASIKKRLPHDVYLYSAFNNLWLKDNGGTFGAEHYWGLLE